MTQPANPGDEFLLDPDVTFLNHGSFGACPRPVFEAYQAWQRELERQPVAFLQRRLPGLLAEANERLAVYVGAPAADVVFVRNATMGANIVAQSLALGPGDEVLGTDHEYGACERAWRFACRQSGAHYVRQPIPLPLTGSGAGGRGAVAGRHAAHAGHLSESHHVGNGADLSRGRSLPAGACRGHPDDDRRRARAGPTRFTTGRAGRGLLHGELPQVVVCAEGIGPALRAA